MTNQTIDGVPRHTLRLALAGIEYLALRADDIGTSSVQLAAELRTLLDAPPRCPDCGYTEQDCREQMDHYLCGLPEPAPANNPAAQPQGEQSAYDPAKENKQFEAWARTQSQVDLRLCDIGLYYERETGLAHDAWQHRAKLAEQPAPVALDVLITGFHTTESGGGKYAINIGFRSLADMQAADAQLREFLKSR
ncbi:hypothetical protein PSFL_07330 [Pseudomonas sp. DD1]|uniref:hypothetical protein n=1 Tax=Pseudomonas sp. DD1 TaxID=879558 RepID=UPI0037C5820F